MSSLRPRIEIAWLPGFGRSRPIALAIVAALAVLGACASKPKLTAEQQAEADLRAYKAQIQKTVTDPARADQLIGAVDEAEQVVRKAGSVIQDYRAKLQALDADYGATRAEYAALFTQHDAQRTALIQQALALRAKITSLTTDSEWEQLKPARREALQTLLEAVARPSPE